MNFCALSPPNTRTLSDIVIGNVIPRTEIHHRPPIAGTRDKRLKKDHHVGHSHPQQSRSRPHVVAPWEPTHPVILEPPKHHVKGSDTVESFSSVINLMGQTDLSTGHKRPSCFLADLQIAKQVIASIQATSHPLTEELKYAIVVEALKKKIRHREHCRTSQARHWNKKHKIIEEAISKLHYEIKGLEAKCKDPPRLPTTPTIWALAAEYSRYFNYYISSPGTLHATASTFLHGIMAPDVMVGSEF